MQFYRDQNEVRHEIQKKGGIHNVESKNIERLKGKGYEVYEYGENFVEMSRKDSNGQSNVSIIHGKNSKSLKIEMNTRDGKEVINSKRKMRSSNGSIETMSRIVDDHLDGNLRIDKLDEEKVRSHFKDFSIRDR